jgi:hypothetical protein
VIVVSAAMLLISACTSDSSPTASETTQAPSEVQTETSTFDGSTTEAPPVTPGDAGTEPGDPAASTGCSLDDFSGADTLKPGSCGGSATVVLGDETIEFDSIGCFTGADAVEATRSDDTTFSSIGVVAHGDGLAAVVVSAQGSAIPIYEILIVLDITSDLVWHGQANDGVVTIDGDQVAFEGEFVEVSGGSTATGAVEVGSIAATCAP